MACPTFIPLSRWPNLSSVLLADQSRPAIDSPMVAPGCVGLPRVFCTTFDLVRTPGPSLRSNVSSCHGSYPSACLSCINHAANDRDHSHSTAARERKLGTTSGGDITPYFVILSRTRATLLQHRAVLNSEAGQAKKTWVCCHARPDLLLR